MKVGDKVVCVSDKPQDGIPAANTEQFSWDTMPVIGIVYVIRGFFLDKKSRLGLKLIGSTVVFLPTGEEVGWYAPFFRKLEECQARNQVNQPQTEVN